MPIKLPKNKKNWGATIKHPEYTDTNVFGHIPDVFVNKKMFFLPDRSCFFSATVCGQKSKK
jgi:hypothetical protein